MSLSERLQEDRYEGYAYSYPHKTAYRPLLPARTLSDVWSQEDRRQLFLYVHVPFCEMRCGFCNLFTQRQPHADTVEATLEAILAQARVTSQELHPHSVANTAIGGGTPSYLDLTQLERLMSGLAQIWSLEWKDTPTSFEVSPGTVTPEKLRLLRQLGIQRLSLGVQSFLESDQRELGRPQSPGQLRQACQWIQEAEFPVWNLDLIYGNPGQSESDWEQNLREALGWRPQELYLYPLYVGAETGLDRLGRRPGERRRSLYRLASQWLRAEGYEALSMRHFRRRGLTLPESDYCCQKDGMVGLGPGARSYTTSLHYSSEYAVGQAGVRAIVSAFGERNFHLVDYGVELSIAEQKRRWLIKSLLRCTGVDRAAYQARFQTEVLSDFPQLEELLPRALVRLEPDLLVLTEEGLAWSDSLGPWLYSPEMQARMAAYEVR